MSGSANGSVSQWSTAVPTGSVLVVVVMGGQHDLVMPVDRALDVDELAPVGLLEDRAGQDFRSAVGDLPAVQAQHAVPTTGLLDVMGRDQERATVGRKGLQQILEPLHAGGVQAGERLVQQDHRSVLDECPGDQDALPLSAGQVPERVLGAVPEPDGRERRTCPVSLGGSGAPPPRQA